MSVTVDKFNRAEWREYSETAHAICFGTHKPADWDRFDFALVVRTAEKLMGYITCREMDAETVYWQFGGAFPETRGTASVWKGYQAFVEFCRGKYKRIGTLIENDNAGMLKMAAKIGFKIVGVRTYAGSVLLEHCLELADA